MSSPTSLVLPRLAVLTAALLFSTGGAAIKATELTPLQVAGLRSLIAALMLALCMPAWRRWLRPRPLLVGLAYAGTMVGFVVANKLTTAANAIFLQSTAPLWVLVLAPLALGEHNRKSDLWLAGVLLAGVVLVLSAAEAPLRTAPDPPLGNLVAVATGFSWACTLVGLRWLARSAPPPGAGARDDEAGAAVVAGNLTAFVACAPWIAPGLLETAGWRDAVAIGYLGVFQIGAAYLFLTRGVRRVAALEVSLLILLEPVCNVLWTWALHGEAPGALAAAGCSVILAATAARVWLARTRMAFGSGELS